MRLYDTNIKYFVNLIKRVSAHEILEFPNHIELNLIWALQPYTGNGLTKNVKLIKFRNEDYDNSLRLLTCEKQAIKATYCNENILRRRNI